MQLVSGRIQNSYYLHSVYLESCGYQRLRNLPNCCTGSTNWGSSPGLRPPVLLFHNAQYKIWSLQYCGHLRGGQGSLAWSVLLLEASACSTPGMETLALSRQSIEAAGAHRLQHKALQKYYLYFISLFKSPLSHLPASIRRVVFFCKRII